MAALVVGGDGHVDVFGGRVGVTQGDDGDVDVACLLDGLGVGARVRHNDEAGLLERPGDVVGEATGGEAAGDGDGASVGGKLEDGTLAVGTRGDDANVGRVVNGDDDAGGEDDLLPGPWEQIVLGGITRDTRLVRSTLDSPGLANVDDVDAIRARLPQVRLHMSLQVFAAKVAVGSKEHLNVLAGRIED